MALTQEEKQNVKDILAVFYSKDILGNVLNPTEETVRLTELLILKVALCNKTVKDLIQSIPAAIVGRGFLRKNLRRVAKEFNKNINGFRGCKDAVGTSLLRTQILSSTW